MHKRMLFIGAFAIAGLVTLTAFGGQTREQQQAQINQAIQEQLEAFRIEMQEACTARIMEEAQVRYDEYVAAQAAATPAKSGVKKSTKKSGPSVDPLPQPTKPVVDPQKTRGGAVQEGNVEEQKTRSGAVPTGDAEAQKKRGGAVKKEGGN